MIVDLFRVISTRSWCGQEAISREVKYYKLTFVEEYILVTRGKVVYEIMRTIMCVFIIIYSVAKYTRN